MKHSVTVLQHWTYLRVWIPDRGDVLMFGLDVDEQAAFCVSGNLLSDTRRPMKRVLLTLLLPGRGCCVSHLSLLVLT